MTPVQLHVSKLLTAYRLLLGKPDREKEREALIEEAWLLWRQLSEDEKSEADKLYLEGVKKLNEEAVR